jgi:hypothetical protein
MKKVILDLYAGTGSWSFPYRRAGYEVIPVTLPRKNVLEYMPPPPLCSKIYGILAAPPCTQLSLARTSAMTARNFSEALLNVKACLEIVWRCALHGNLKFWALENPVGLLRRFLGDPPFTFNPYDFGDPWTKRTDLWGNYSRPGYRYTAPLYSIEHAAKNQIPALLKLRGVPLAGLVASDFRAVTPPGFAMEFYKSNR